MYMNAELYEQMLEREKEKVKELEEDYASILRTHNVCTCFLYMYKHYMFCNVLLIEFRKII